MGRPDLADDRESAACPSGTDRRATGVPRGIREVFEHRERKGARLTDEGVKNAPIVMPERLVLAAVPSADASGNDPNWCCGPRPAVHVVMVVAGRGTANPRRPQGAQRLEGESCARGFSDWRCWAC